MTRSRAVHSRARPHVSKTSTAYISHGHGNIDFCRTVLKMLLVQSVIFLPAGIFLSFVRRKQGLALIGDTTIGDES